MNPIDQLKEMLERDDFERRERLALKTAIWQLEQSQMKLIDQLQQILKTRTGLHRREKLALKTIISWLDQRECRVGSSKTKTANGTTTHGVSTSQLKNSWRSERAALEPGN